MQPSDFDSPSKSWWHLLKHSGQAYPPQSVGALISVALLYLWLAFGYMLCRIISRDYKAFLSLGPGGTSQTFSGFIKLSCLRIFCLKEPLQAPPILPRIYPKRGYLSSDLGEREGPRPVVKGLAPQRQITQRASSEMYDAAYDVMKTLVKEYPDELFIATSAIEGHSPAIFSKIATPSGFGQRTVEICHLHGIDGSLHAVLHPADIEKVLGSGYGERHPLARTDWWWQWPVVPEGFVLLYSCRGAADLAVLRVILCAAACNVCGKYFG